MFTYLRVSRAVHDPRPSAGLLGCYWAAGWRDWCVSPEMEVRPDGLRPNLGRQEARVLSPKKEIQAIHKPPLVSPRMSALLCTTYCINGPVRHPIAVLMVSWGGGRWGRGGGGRWEGVLVVVVVVVVDNSDNCTCAY